MMKQEPVNPVDVPEPLPTSHFEVTEGEGAETAAWEEVAAGRFMPRRIKGSCKGRALG